MPGAYAHLTAVNVAREPERIQRAAVPGEAALALGTQLRFAELGAVSPDYPYLAIGDSDAEKWADRMHYERTGELVIELINRVRAATASRAKLLAWVLGYVAHVACDVTIHPVVELKVGPYAANKADHRKCEMNQDVYIFQRLNLGELAMANHLKSGVVRCHASGDTNKVDPDVGTAFREALLAVHGSIAGASVPDVDRWHKGFALMVDKLAEEGQRLVPLARHVAAGRGLTYPLTSEVNRKEYIDALRTPDGVLTYDQIFDRAVGNVGAAWKVAAEGALGKSETYRSYFGAWNLDTGRDERTAKFVFWRNP